MGDDERDASVEHAGETALDALLRLGIDGRRGLVHDEDLRVGEDRPRERDELLLARRQPVAAFAGFGGVAVLEPA